MARYGELLYQQRGRLMLALAGLMLATGSVFLSEPLLTLCQENPHELSIFLPVYAYLFLLIPLTFFFNILLLLRHITAHAVAPDVSLKKQYLPPAAGTVSFATLLLSAPLLVRVSVAEESVAFVIAAALAILALITILTSVIKKLLSPSFSAGGGFAPALFFLCIATGASFISFDPLFSFSKQNHHDPITPHILIHLLLSFISFLIFMLGITLLIICIGTPAGGPHIMIRCQNLAIAGLSVAIAILLVGWYMKYIWWSPAHDLFLMKQWSYE